MKAISVSYTHLDVYKRQAYHHKGLIGFIFNLFWFSFGGLVCLLNTQSLKKNYYANDSYSYLKVWVKAEPQLTNNILRFEVEVTKAYLSKTSENVSGKLLIALKIDSHNPIKINYGCLLYTSRCV